MILLYAYKKNSFSNHSIGVKYMQIFFIPECLYFILNSTDQNEKHHIRSSSK